MTSDILKDLFYDNYERLYHIAYQYVGNESASEDVVQECFISFWEKFGNNFSNINAGAYLTTSVKNRAISYLRKRSNSYVSIEDANIEASAESLCRSEKEVNTNSLLMQALDLLPEKCRQVFLMSRINNKKYNQIAEDLQISIKTVENQMGKAIKIMRDYANQHPELFYTLLLLCVHKNINS